MRYGVRIASAVLAISPICVRPGIAQQAERRQPQQQQPAQAQQPSAPPQAPQQQTPAQPQPPTREPLPRVPQQEIAPVSFVSGMVLLDGGASPKGIRILAICGRSRAEAHTDAKGRFTFQAGGELLNTGHSGRRLPEVPRCSLQATYPGYRPAAVELPPGATNAGVTVLHRLAQGEGSTVSITDLQAPNKAKGAYEKALAEMRKQKWDAAERQLTKAVALYPKYASAWYQLGLVYRARKEPDRARTSFEQAIAADGSYTPPYVAVTEMNFSDQQWAGVISTSDRLLRLDPTQQPVIWFYNAIANLNTGNLKAAESAARRTLKLDPNHRLPAAEHVLGVVLAQKGDYAGATEHFRAYLTHAPGAPDAAAVRAEIEKAEKLAHTPAASTENPR